MDTTQRTNEDHRPETLETLMAGCRRSRKSALAIATGAKRTQFAENLAHSLLDDPATPTDG